jgi:hypothetical protein
MYRIPPQNTSPLCLKAAPQADLFVSLFFSGAPSRRNGTTIQADQEQVQRRTDADQQFMTAMQRKGAIDKPLALDTPALRAYQSRPTVVRLPH